MEVKEETINREENKNEKWWRWIWCGEKNT
jgi:hypothetical protein